jgi:ribonuclease HI
VAEWRFVLEALDGSARLEAADEEPDVEPDRLELLAVVRGLEALNQPSRVTLVTPSRYVSRGFRFGLNEWRENDWQWERFGEMAPIKNGDLWRRVDRAMRFHKVECRTWRFDAPETHPRVRTPAMKRRSPSHRRRETARERRSAKTPRRSRIATVLQRLRPNAKTALDVQTA